MTDPNQPVPNFIYKICSHHLWQQAKKTGHFTGAPVDIEDGFIHFSTADQMKETAEKHFHGQTDLQLIQIDVTDLNIVWEVSRGGQLFPHLYDVLPLSAVVRAWDLPLDQNNKHLFPESD